MRATKIITAVCWCVTALVLVGLAGWFATGFFSGDRSDGWWSFNFNIGGWESLTGPYEPAGSYNMEISGVDSMNIEWIAGDVNVEPHDGSEILVTEYAQRELNDNEKLRIGTSGGTLTIRYTQDSKIRRMPAKRLTVLVPRELIGTFKNFTADSTSGDLTISGVGADSFTADTTSGGLTISGGVANSFKADSMSGDMNLSNITSQIFDADTTSGGITIDSFRADSMTLSSMSGDIRVTNASVRTAECDTTSGLINLSGSFDKADLESMSGDVTLNNAAVRSVLAADTTSGRIDCSGDFDRASFESMSGNISVRSTSVPSELDAETTSGAISVTVPDEGGVSVSHSATSGKLSSDIPIITGGDNARFKFSTMSGNVRIYRLD